MASNNIKSQPDRYVPSFVKSYIEGSREVQLNFEEASKTNIESTGSFRYDPPGAGLKSTQQVNVDFSKFENHTFFNSAEANVNVAFDTIVNNYPFDGTRKEVEAFFDKLTGFEKWVYDQFPKNKGFLMFSGTQQGEVGDNGTYLEVKDFAGGLYPDLSKNKTGESLLDPKANSFSIELQLFLSTKTNVGQVVCQKISQDETDPTRRDGFSLFIDNGSSSACDLVFAVTSGSFSLNVSSSLTKGQFNHVCAVMNRESSYNKLQLFVNEALVAESSSSINFEDFGIHTSPLLIGSGTYVTIEDGVHLPEQTLSGAIDELRIYHNARGIEQQKLFAKKSVYGDTDLKLYYKFNEPYGTLGSTSADTINRIVLDNSGNSLHSLINADGWFNGLVRLTSSITGPMTHEKMELSPVLFPSFTDVLSLNSRLLASASLYDQENPNLITKLVPSHYFLEGQLFEGLQEESGTMGNAYGGSTLPGSGRLGTAQVFSSFLFVWAKFFDELKIFADTFSRLKYVDYQTTETTPDSFLLMLSKWYGFNMPSFFSNASMEQFVNAENITDTISTSDYSLKFIQNQILRRILTNMNEFIRSKGTIHSIKSFLRAFGINPDNSFRIREFGGPTTRQLANGRETKLEPASILSMSAGALLRSNYLSGSRTEVGFPQIRGAYVNKTAYPPHGISDNRGDGMFTSGSWTYEGIYKFPLGTNLASVTQSLARIHTTGSHDHVFANLIAVSGTEDTHRLCLYVAPALSGSTTSIDFTGIDLFDGNKWHISFGRQDAREINSSISSSYFLRAAKVSNGEIVDEWVSSSYAADGNTITRPLAMYDVNYNVSGAYIAIGSQSLDTTNPYVAGLNSGSAPEEARHTLCEAQLSQIRFWSKALSMPEFIEHARNYKSLGVDDPAINFNFYKVHSGSWQRLRVDTSVNQDEIDASSGGTIRLFDFSQNQRHFSGSGFPASTQVINGEMYSYSHISPVFDEAVTNEKVRIRSFKNSDYLRDTPWAGVAPIYRIEPSETPTDDTRFSIEFSVIDALNRDMINIFSTLDTINNVIGTPELMFSPDYPDLEHLRSVYFNRLTDKINLKGFFEFFKWFDTSVGTFIEQLIPRKTVFFGVNYVVESHFLERPKVEYYHNKAYLAYEERALPGEELPIQNMGGTVKRY